MTIDEARKAIDEMKAQGQSEEEIAGAFYLMFRDDKINVEQLEALVNLLGFELDEEFKMMDTEQQKQNGYEVLDQQTAESPEGKPTSEQNEEETSDNEEEEKAMNLLGQGKKEEKKDEKVSDTSKNDDEEDEEEEKEAMKFFR